MFTSESSDDSFADMAFLVRAFHLSHMLEVAVALELADRIADGPQPISKLALEAQAEPTMLLRLCRALAAFGIFAVDASRNLSQTARSAHLCQTVVPTLYYATRYYASKHVKASWANLEHAVRSGESALESVYGMPKFEYLKTHPDESDVFDAFMRHSPEDRHAAVAQTYDFSETALVVDIGGGNGALLAAILDVYPRTTGLLFDQAHVVIGATDTLERFAGRLRLARGSFFESVPAGGDVYTLAQILHDWNDAHCLSILHNVHAAMKPGARLLIVERLLEGEVVGHSDPITYLADISMMVNLQGRQRTLEEFTALLTPTGFSVPRVLRTRSSFSILETLRL